MKKAYSKEGEEGKRKRRVPLPDPALIASQERE
jgi:hypothetical protein